MLLPALELDQGKALTESPDSSCSSLKFWVSLNKDFAVPVYDYGLILESEVLSLLPVFNFTFALIRKFHWSLPSAPASMLSPFLGGSFIAAVD